MYGLSCGSGLCSASAWIWACRWARFAPLAARKRPPERPYPCLLLLAPKACLTSSTRPSPASWPSTCKPRAPWSVAPFRPTTTMNFPSRASPCTAPTLAPLGKEDAYIAQTRKGIIQMCATGTQTGSLFRRWRCLKRRCSTTVWTSFPRAMNGETFKLINKGFAEKSGLTMMNAFPLAYFWHQEADQGHQRPQGIAHCGSRTFRSTSNSPNSSARAASRCLRRSSVGA